MLLCCPQYINRGAQCSDKALAGENGAAQSLRAPQLLRLALIMMAAASQAALLKRPLDAGA